MATHAILRTCVTTPTATLCAGLTVELLADCVRGDAPAVVRHVFDGRSTIARVNPLLVLPITPMVNVEAAKLDSYGDCYCDEIADALAGHP
jgi:hypothetical protein